MWLMYFWQEWGCHLNVSTSVSYSPTFKQTREKRKTSVFHQHQHARQAGREWRTNATCGQAPQTPQAPKAPQGNPGQMLSCSAKTKMGTLPQLQTRESTITWRPKWTQMTLTHSSGLEEQIGSRKAIGPGLMEAPGNSLVGQHGQESSQTTGKGRIAFSYTTVGKKTDGMIKSAVMSWGSCVVDQFAQTLKIW